MNYYNIFKFKDFCDDRGHLTAIEGLNDIPFEIKRIYYITGVKDGVVRGYHAHRNLHQVLLCICGSVKIKVITPTEEKVFILDNATKGLFLGPYTWREMYDFSQDAVLLVLASENYSGEDYIRNIGIYKEEAKNILGDYDGD